MTGAAGRMVLVVLGLLLVLTYLLLRGAAPDAAQHERRLRAMPRKLRLVHCASLWVQ